ncbi:hypothetical protein ORJ00_09685 [Rheinheimera baltica]|nr:hypothetical protein [Rheinheimera baltica]MDP5143014.1 hypothetical protein [Rheinheimera baltica]
MATIQLLIGGSALVPSASNKLKKKKEIAEKSLQDNSVTIDRILAARMRDALVSEAKILERMGIAEFRNMLKLQGFNTNKFSDVLMAAYLQSEVSAIKSIALRLLRDDLIKAETPIIISGNVSGAVGMVAKILGPTAVAGFSPISTTIWWDCKTDCRIESIHFFDKTLKKVIKL